MMRGIDFSTWQGLLTTLATFLVITLLGVGVRLLVMMTVQQRRERTNRQINERLRTLIAAYKTLGGSFTGDLMVDPRHLRDLRRAAPAEGDEAAIDLTRAEGGEQSDRARRIRDAVESALSDIILLGTEEQVRLAADAAAKLAAGEPVPTQALVASLRAFIRDALDLDPVPDDIAIPQQGPTRPAPGGGRGGGGGGERGGGGRGGGGGGGAMAGGGAGMMVGGAGLGLGLGQAEDRLDG